MAVGVDPAADPKVFTVKDYIRPAAGCGRANTASCGQEMAELLDISLGDLVTLRMRTRTRTLQALDLEVVGLVATPHPRVNQSQVFLPLDVAQEATGAGGGVTAMVARTEEKADVEAVAASDPRARTWDRRRSRWRPGGR